MSEQAPSVASIARQIGDTTGLARAVDDVLDRAGSLPLVLALGEPTHGIGAFPLLRNELLAHLVGRGFRSIALETDIFAAGLVADYVNGADTDLDAVLTSGFSHGFGGVLGNRELLQWLRAYNNDRTRADRIHFHGFDAPVEYSGAPGPRAYLTAVLDFLPPARQPAIDDLEQLLGDDAAWTNPGAMYDPTVSIGGTARARALRVVADDLASALRRAAPQLQPIDPDGHRLATANARTALGLLRYHAAMATAGPDRIDGLLGLRAEMMVDNLLAIIDQESRRGPTLVFAHNRHLQPAEGGTGAGALARLELGNRYRFVATDGAPTSTAGTLQGTLAAGTDRRALFPGLQLLALLPEGLEPADPMVPGHLPLTSADLVGADAVVFIADTDGRQQQYW